MKADGRLLGTFPDSEAIVSSVLRAAGIAGGRVYSSIPKSPTYPLVVVSRTGGVPLVRQYLDQARITVEIWGTSKSEAHGIATEARAAIFSAEASTVSEPEPAWIAAVDDAAGLAWVPDSATARDRYVFTVSIAARLLDPV